MAEQSPPLKKARPIVYFVIVLVLLLVIDPCGNDSITITSRSMSTSKGPVTPG